MDIGNIGVIKYGMIIDRVLMKSLDLIIDFEHKSLHYNDIDIPVNMTTLNNRKEFDENFQLATEPKIVQKATEWVTKNLDVHYEKTNLADVVKCHCCHPSIKSHVDILNLLFQYEYLFNWTLGTLYTKSVHLESKKDTSPKHIKRPFQLQKELMTKLWKKELN